MRLSYLLSAGTFALSFLGCSFATTTRAPMVDTVPIGACNPFPCAKVTIATLPELPGSFTSEARAAIRERVDRALYAPLDDGQDDISRDRFLESVKVQYEDYLEVKDPDTVVDWQVARSAFIIYVNEDFASVVVKNEGFLGGAHGFSDEQIFVFDGKSGKVLTWDDILSPDSKGIFLKAAEAEFRRARDIKPMETLEEAGFTFDDNTFTLSQNFALTDKGISLHYNPYEVGPYVMGATDFVVPLDVVGPALNTSVINVAHLVPEARSL
jgi:hypothetical protein